MPELYNHVFNPAELHALTATLEQLAGIRLVEYADGKARGMRAAEVRTGSGFNFTVWLDRGMDLGPAEYAGAPLAWLHPALGTPALYDPAGRGWTRTFGGGLLTTCGLTHFGQPETSEGQDWGLHGRISHTPAANVCASARWEGGEYRLSLTGEMREAVLPGVNLLLRRTISTQLGARSLKINDTVSNEAYTPAPHMLLYHINFGFPLIAPGTTFEIDSAAVRPRDEAARAGLDDYARIGAPTPDFQAQVFFHTPRPDPDGYVSVRIHSPLCPGAYLRYHAASLPALSQWKLTRSGLNVCSFEPCTAHEAPRAELRRQGLLRELAPGESVSCEVEIGLL
jgi:hypothetical protein